jgi:ribosomal protein S18 acetylase RimI-like enzyme
LTAPPSSFVIRPLTAANEPSLATFTCANYREPWTVPVQDMVREGLAGNLAIGAVRAVGAWVGDELKGVAVWRIDGNLCHSILLAVSVGYRRRGVARALKSIVLSDAVGSGAVAAVSDVHWDNEAMIALNVEHGATVERIPGDLDYCRCIIPLS